MKRLTESHCIQAIQDFILECDADDLARLTGELFGGECFATDECYEFEPNENYTGQFDNVKDN